VTATTEARLHHVGFGVSDPQATAALLRDAFELEIAGQGDAHVDVHIGASTLKLYDLARCNDGASGPLPARYVALSVSVPRAGVEEAARGAVAGALRAVGGPADARVLDPGQWSGVSLVVTSEARAHGCADMDRNVRGIDHIGVASQDNSLVRDQFAGVLGLEVESEQTDTEVLVRVEQFVSTRHGFRSVSNTVPERSSGLRVLFVTLPPVDFEFLQDLGGRPVETGAGAGSTFGDKSAIGKYVDKRGPGVHHVALRVRDIDAAIARASSAGLHMIDSQGRPGSRRANIAFVHPRSAGSILWHFVQR
jgi:catechol 2,3-dioxygenase-like lactoylglutathione lyase family enzyme